jgi:hypothetical protein
LFSHWLSQAPYEELFDLQEEGLHLRCRSTPLGQPALRGGELDAENSEARQTLMALIAQAPLHQWISFAAFTRFVYRLNPTFLQRRQRIFSSPHWWLEQEEGRVLRPTVLSDWSRAEGRYLARLVEGPLYWWGVCDLVHAHDGRLLAFRLTSLAGLLLNGQAAEDVDEEEPLVNVREQLQGLSVKSGTDEVTIPCSSAYWPQIELIETFAEVAGVENEQLRYQLSPKSLSEAMGRGKDPAALLEVLQSARGEGMEVPGQGIAPTRQPEMPLRERLANYGRVRLYTGVTLLELADTLALRELSATTSLEKQVVQTVSPTLLILKKQGAERLVEELKRRGQVPLLHEEEQYGAE